MNNFISLLFSGQKLLLKKLVRGNRILKIFLVQSEIMSLFMVLMRVRFTPLFLSAMQNLDLC